MALSAQEKKQLSEEKSQLADAIKTLQAEKAKAELDARTAGATAQDKQHLADEKVRLQDQVRRFLQFARRCALPNQAKSKW